MIFHQVISAYVITSQRPQSYQDLVDLGVKVEINLESGVYDDLHPNDGFDNQAPADFGIDRYRIPMSDFFPPTQKQFDKIDEVIKQAVWNGKIVDIHCEKGKDRTGMVRAWYRMKYNHWTYSAAKQEMYNLGFNRLFYWWWVPTLKKYADGP